MTESCDSGEGRCCDNLDSKYLLGRDVNKDIAKANSLYEKACKLDEGVGCLSLLWYNYENGVAVSLNEITAKALFGKACDLGVEDGCELYARLHKAGIK